MKLRDYDFKLINRKWKDYYYDTIYETLTSTVAGRKSEPNILLIGNNTVESLKFFSDESLMTFFGEIFIGNQLGNCIGFIEKSSNFKSYFIDKNLNDWDSSERTKGEIIGLSFSDDKNFFIRKKEELSLNESLKLLSASITTSIIFSSYLLDELSKELSIGLYYDTEKYLNLIDEVDW